VTPIGFSDTKASKQIGHVLASDDMTIPSTTVVLSTSSSSSSYDIECLQSSSDHSRHGPFSNICDFCWHFLLMPHNVRVTHYKIQI
jgi:hypothetical protein